MFSIEVAVVQQSSLHFSQHAIDSGIVIAEHCRHPCASTWCSQWYRFCKELTVDQPLLGISGGSMVLQDRALSICMWVTWLSSRLELPVTIYVSNQLWHDEIWCRDEAWSRGRATLLSLMATKGKKNVTLTECNLLHSSYSVVSKSTLSTRVKCQDVVLLSSSKLASGFLSFHLLKADTSLFGAKMDVLALPVWHPKGLCHVILHIKSWSGRQTPRPWWLYIWGKCKIWIAGWSCTIPHWPL